MDLSNKTNRAQLRNYFKKNAIPTESHFADLIGSMINQADDSIAKIDGQPVSLQPDTGDLGNKDVLNLYKSFDQDDGPSWKLSLTPLSNPNNPASAKPGLSVGDKDGTSKLFISESTDGNVGIGTTSPAAKLDIADVIRSGTHPKKIKGLYVTGEFGPSSDGVEFRHTNGTQGIGFGSNTIYAAGSSSHQDINLKPKGNGNVGIGTTNPPSAKLEVNGNAQIGESGEELKIGNVGHSSWAGIAHKDRASGTDYALIQNSSGETILNSKSDQCLRFRQGNADKMVIDTDGNVGIGTIDPKTKLQVDEGRLEITASKGVEGGGNRFTGIFSSTEHGYRRAQLVLSSGYSDLVIASSHSNNTHGSTLTFATYNPSNASDYKKWVINQGNWGSRKQMLDFGYSNTGGRINPHSNINSTDTVLTLDGANKRVGIGTTTPSYPLHVTKTMSNNWQGHFNNGTSNVYLAHSGGYGMHINTGKTDSSSRYALEVKNSSGTHLYVRDDGHIGIGTTAPSYPLYVTKTMSNNWQGRFNNGTSNVYLAHGGGYGMHINTGKTDSSSRYALEVRNSSGTHLYVRDDGYIGIGTISPRAPLHVASRSGNIGGSNFRSGAGHKQYWSIGCYEWVGAQGFKSWSDARVKTNATPLDTQNSLEKINQLKLVDYNHISEYMGGAKGRGVYAQEVEEIFPEAISIFEEMKLDNGEILKDFHSVNYDWLFVTGLSAIQELSKHITELKNQIKLLKKKTV